MKRGIITLIILAQAILGGWAQSAEPEFLFESANQKYLNGEFTEARDGYLKIVSSGLESAELYYNLGNTFYKLGEIPSAILYFEKALKIKPRDKDILFNLDIANQLTTDKTEILPEFFLVRWIKASGTILPGDIWALLSLISLAAITTLVIGVAFKRDSRNRKLLIVSALFAILIMLISFNFARSDYRTKTSPLSGIIFEPAVKVKSTPDENGTDLFILHQGTKVGLGEKLNEWIEIRLSDGNTGWLPASVIEVI